MLSKKREDLRDIFKDYFKNKEQLGISESNIKEIVKVHAYKDMTPRTIQGLTKDKIKDALEYLAEKVYKYISSSEIYSKEKYDEWHKETCEEFVKKSKKMLEPNIAEKITAGKAQKILNMTMKYVYCCSDEEIDVDKFMWCHVALDHFTLENWFSNDVLDWLNEPKEKKDKINKGRMVNWSNLKYGNSKEIWSYCWIQERIREYLDIESGAKGNKYEGLTPFQAEFYVWQDEKTREALLQVLKLKESKNKRVTIYEMCEKVIEVCNGLKECV